MVGKMFTEAVYTKEGFTIPIEWMIDDNAPTHPNKGIFKERIGNITSADLVKGEMALVDNGIIRGKLDIDQVYTMNKDIVIPIETFDVADGSKGLKFILSLGNATPADLAKGKTAFTDAGKITGTLEATGGEPSYTLQIATENDSDNPDSIIYYAPGDSMKTPLGLTTSYQSITCGDFICLQRNNRDNYASAIDFLDSNGAHLLSVSASTNPNYVVNIKPVGLNIINIGAIKRDYSNVSQILVKYMV